MLNKEKIAANKKIFIAAVIALMAVSFIALRIAKPKIKSVEIGTVATTTATSTEEKKVNLSDIVSEGQIAEAKPVREISDKDHILGSTSAPVKVIVYSDFECLYCAQFADTLAQARKDFGEKIAIVFRHYPLTELHQNAELAAEASECAAEQGKFWEMHDGLFKAESEGRLNREAIDKLAKDLKLDKFASCLDGGKYKEKIAADIVEGREATVSGSPTAFVNGELVTGANPYEDGERSDGSKLEGLKSIIERKLADKKLTD